MFMIPNSSVHSKEKVHNECNSKVIDLRSLKNEPRYGLAKPDKIVKSKQLQLTEMIATAQSKLRPVRKDNIDNTKPTGNPSPNPNL